MVQSDKRVLWHPRHDNKFVVGGNSQITLYEWASDFPEIRHITSQHDLHHMKCFAWSPDPAFEDLLAVGLSTGRVDLIRLEASKQSRHAGSLHNNTPILSTGTAVSLPVRTSRSCNALAFCTKDPNYLAVGLDKIRNDSSLIVWDISTSRQILVDQGLPSSTDTTIVNAPTPRPHPQIPRIDNRADPRILQQHALTEAVSSVAFIPNSTHLLLAGVSHRWLRLFDLRSTTAAVTNVASKVQGLATDPFDAHRIASFGDGTVALWDHRKLTHPLLTFSEKDAAADGARIRQNATYAHIEFSGVRRGCLGTLEKDAGYVRFWDVTEARGLGAAEGSVFGGSSDGEGKSSRDSVRGARRTWGALPWSASQSQPLPNVPKLVENPATPERTSQAAYILADTRRTKTFSRPLASFTIVPSQAHSHPQASNIMIVNKEGDLELYQIHDTPKQALWSSRGELAIGAGVGLKLLEGYRLHAPPLDADAAFLSHHPDARQASSSYNRDDAQLRGRPSKPSTPSMPPSSALFGRDEDAYGALSGVSAQFAMTTLGGPRGGKARGYSPASFRKYAKDKDRDGERREVSVGPHGRGLGGALPLRERLAESRSRERGVSPGPPAPRHKSAGRVPRVSKGVGHVIEEDISMIMRKRALRGYGLRKPHDNVNIVQEEQDSADSAAHSLPEVWSWIYYSRELLCNPTPRLHGFDFAFQGLAGIWEGLQPSSPQAPPNSVDDTPIAVQRSLLLDVPGSLPTHHSQQSSSAGGVGTSRRSHSPADDLYGNWNAVLAVLIERRGVDKTSWKPSLPTTKLAQRQLALQLCGWSLRDEELKAAVKRWEKEGKVSRAACWLVFTKQYSKAMEVLMRSHDEMHRMMSGTIAALIPHNSSALKNPELRDHYSRLSIRLQDPYFRMMITHMGVGDWTDVLEEETIPFRERLAIAFQFLDDRSLSSYLNRLTHAAASTGNTDAIIVTGLTKPGLDILQAYVDHTGDVQTAAIMGSYVCPVKFRDRRVEVWLQTYRDLLDGFKLHHERVEFDIERGQIMLDAHQTGDLVSEELIPPQILIRCHYCNKPVNSGEMLSARGPLKGRPTTCPNCSRSLPKCSVCLMTLGIVDDASREIDLGYSQFKDTIDDAIVICQTCRHGGHAAHLLEWFLGEDGRRAHMMCPVAGCDCRCADEF
ncbi:hypothetical protein FA15DRAFT_618942 [Coprinopsis marcescibilis]|uniref:Uncharacterized protein n=1 Tax=Coprinopsis marcescibilis TaxID=230819 RepID=A0A5C3KX68_COPMA|nr:hypothetical protein FA15DRAFT_618942 [Coprinopsis marcescibilis]